MESLKICSVLMRNKVGKQNTQYHMLTVAPLEKKWYYKCYAGPSQSYCLLSALWEEENVVYVSKHDILNPVIPTFQLVNEEK